jgi:hypothetical protein
MSGVSWDAMLQQTPRKRNHSAIKRNYQNVQGGVVSVGFVGRRHHFITAAQP